MCTSPRPAITRAASAAIRPRLAIHSARVATRGAAETCAAAGTGRAASNSPLLQASSSRRVEGTARAWCGRAGRRGRDGWRRWGSQAILGGKIAIHVLHLRVGQRRAVDDNLGNIAIEVGRAVGRRSNNIEAASNPRLAASTGKHTDAVAGPEHPTAVHIERIIGAVVAHGSANESVAEGGGVNENCSSDAAHGQSSNLSCFAE